MHRLLTFTALVWCLSRSLSVHATTLAPIYYSRLLPGQRTVELWRINPDGSNDQRVAVTLTEPGFPAWSRDGRVLALTSINPLRPFKISRDVFLFDTVTGALQVAAAFQDMTTNEPVIDDTGQIVGQRANYTFHLPFYKALSPDNSRIVVSNFVRSGFNQGSPPPDVGMSGGSTVPILQVYRVADGFPQELLFIGRVRTGFTLGGFGVDWHPTLNLIACSVDVDTPLDENPSVPAESSAIFLVEPVQDPVSQGRFRKLTFPRASQRSDLFTATLAHQTDYGPAFSPDGTRVAYLRGLVIFDTDSQGITKARPVAISLRVVNLDGTGDRAVTDLNPGFFVNQVSWSPTGQQLVFDAGQQPAPQPLQGPTLFAAPETLELYLINADGSGLTRLRGPGTGLPAWAPRTTSVGQPIRIASQPQNQTVEAGSDVTLSVLATGGRAPLGYQWRRNNIDLPGATGPTLALRNVPAGTAQFTVTITDGFETVVSSVAELTVTPARTDSPIFIQARIENRQLKLSWPAAGAYTLQHASTLGGGGVWTDVPAAQTQTEGDIQTFAFPIIEPGQFFRLVQP